MYINAAQFLFIGNHAKRLMKINRIESGIGKRTSEYRLNLAGVEKGGRATRLVASLPFVALGYVLVFSNLLGGSVLDDNSSGTTVSGETVPNLGNRIFWPVLFILCIALAVSQRSRLRWDFFRSPAIAALIAFLMLAGASLTWSFSPEFAINRYAFQLMLIVIVVLPYAIETPDKNTLKRLLNWYALSIAINAMWVLFEKPQLTEAGGVFGYQGYFVFKGYLGECASIAILISLYALRSNRWQRALALLTVPLSILLIFMSHSKGSLAFALFSPIWAALMLLASKRIPMVVVVAILVGFYFVISSVSDLSLNRISYSLYGDASLTGRTIIWDFIEGQISQRPWLGWGFHSFWLIGPSSPSITQAPAWVSHMTGSHSGYLDVKLETGRLGYAIFMFFIVASIHTIGRVARSDLFQAWVFLSLVLYVISTNVLETVWFQTDPLWVVFLLVVADATCYRYSGTASISRNLKLGGRATRGRARVKSQQRQPVALSGPEHVAENAASNVLSWQRSAASPPASSGVAPQSESLQAATPST
jgi:exopolysaccharide production protein ExoQ